MARKLKRVEPQQIKDGEWYAMTFGGPPSTEECCDCGLVHKVSYAVQLGRLWVRYDIDKRATADARERRKSEPRQPRRPRKEPDARPKSHRR